MAGKSIDSGMALKSWELENNIETIPACDEIFRYDAQQQQQILAAKPWDKDPHFFKDIQISALALLKMVMHARSGGTLEVMGLLLGKVIDNTMVSKLGFCYCYNLSTYSLHTYIKKCNLIHLQVVMDSFALPVEGTETRVNAQSQAYEYMTAYIESAKEVGK